MRRLLGLLFVALVACIPGRPTSLARRAAAPWEWHDVPAALCRDGSSTGYAVSRGPGSSVLLFLEGGGLCVNATTCAKNPSHASSADFAQLRLGGIFDRANSGNPLASWSFVYVPYCSGDFHVGAADATIAGVGSEHFAGSANLGAYLAELPAQFPGVDQVLLAGVSAGGFGAALSYPRVAAAFAPAPVELLDDSGPVFAGPWFTACWQETLRSTWGLDRTVQTSGQSLPDFVTSYMAASPARVFGVVDSDHDHVIAGFYGWGGASCEGVDSGQDVPLTPTRFAAGLADLRARLPPNAATFVFAGDEHTSLGTPRFYERTAGGVALSDWVAQLVGGTVTNEGP